MTDDDDKLLEKQAKKFEREVEESKRLDELKDFKTPIMPAKLMRLHQRLAVKHEQEKIR